MEEAYLIPIDGESYNDYIARIQSSNRNISNEDYLETHHIIPKCCKGSNDLDNLIQLYPQEHYYAHKLLALENPNNSSLQHAWWNMCHCGAHKHDRNCFVPPEEYAEAKRRHSIQMSLRFSGENNPQYGKIVSEETREKLRQTSTGRKHSQATKHKLSLALSGDKNPMYGRHRYGKENPMYGKSGSLSPHAKKVKCVDTQEVFDCILDAANNKNIKTPGNITKAIKRGGKAGGYYWEYYIEDVIGETKHE